MPAEVPLEDLPSEETPVTPPDLPAGAPAGAGVGYKAVIYDQAGVDYALPGKRRGIAPERFGAASWTIEARGGLGEFSLAMNARTTELSEIVQGDRVEIWDGPLLVYVGNIEERTRQKGKPDQLLLTGYGPLFRLEKLPARINQQGIKDIAALASAIISSSVSPYLSGLVLDLPGSTGYELEGFTAQGKSVAQAMSDLVAFTGSSEASPGGAWVWGVDVDASRTYRLYLRPVATSATRVISVPGAHTLAATGQHNGADVLNRARFRGGTAPYGGNLIRNASFESPVTADEDTGVNLLRNGSFEDGSPVSSGWGVPDWIQESTASAKHRGDSGEEDPFEGEWHIETDSSGEAFYQDVVTTIQAGHTYQLVLHARPEGGSTAGGSAELYWRNGGGSYVLTNPDGSAMSWLPIDCAVAAYEKFLGRWTAPSGATGVRVRALRNIGGGQLYWDKFSLFDLASTSQESWKATLLGTVSAVFNWAYTGAAFDGGTSVQIAVTGANTTTNRVRVEPTETSTIVPGARYLFSVWYQCSGAAPAGRLEMEYFKQDGSRARIDNLPFSHGSAVSVWTTQALIATAPTDAVSAKCRLYLEADGTWLLDAATLADTRGLAGIPGVDAPYLEAATLYALYKAEDLVTSGEDAEVNGSFAALGWREASGEVKAESISSMADLARFAKGWFLSHTRAQRQPSITVVAPGALLWPTDLVRLEGEDGPQLTGSQALPIARIRGTGGQLVTYALELGREQPTIEALIQQTVKTTMGKTT
jgi:hypothetical protein